MSADAPIVPCACPACTLADAGESAVTAIRYALTRYARQVDPDAVTWAVYLAREAWRAALAFRAAVPHDVTLPGLAHVRALEYPDAPPVADVPPSAFTLTAPAETEPRQTELFR